MRSSFYRRMTLCACLCASAAAAPSAEPTSLFPDPLPTHYRTGRRLATALEQPISGAWKGVPLRAILRRLSHERQIAILLDRRVDPEQELQVETGDRPLRAAVNEIAQTTQLGVTQVGNCLIVAPSVPVLRLRTLIALRDRELERAAVGTEVLSQVARTVVPWLGTTSIDQPTSCPASGGSSACRSPVSNKFPTTYGPARRSPRRPRRRLCRWSSTSST